MKKKIMSLCCFLLAIVISQNVFAQVPIVSLSTHCINSATPSITVTVSNYPALTSGTLIFASGSNCLTAGSYTTNASKSFTVSVIPTAPIGSGNYWLAMGDTNTLVVVTFIPSSVSISDGIGCVQNGQRVSLTASPALCSSCTYSWTAGPGTDLGSSTGNPIRCTPQKHGNGMNNVVATYNISGCTVSSPPYNFTFCGPRPEMANSNTDELNVFPNPSNGVFTITIPNVTDKASANLYDYTGKTVRSLTLVQGTNHINATDLSSGEYNLIILIDGQSYPKKIIIAK